MEICNAAPGVAESGFNGLVKVLDKGETGDRRDAMAQVSSSDKVSVSRDGLLLTEAMRTAHNTPDVRADRVAEIRARLDNGTYQIDSVGLAAALVREEPGLFKV